MKVTKHSVIPRIMQARRYTTFCISENHGIFLIGPQEVKKCSWRCLGDLKFLVFPAACQKLCIFFPKSSGVMEVVDASHIRGKWISLLS